MIKLIDPAVKADHNIYFLTKTYHISQAFEGEHKNQGEGSQLINR
jgi:hypothetical protein